MSRDIQVTRAMQPRATSLDPGNNHACASVGASWQVTAPDIAVGLPVCVDAVADDSAQ